MYLTFLPSWSYEYFVIVMKLSTTRGGEGTLGAYFVGILAGTYDLALSILVCRVFIWDSSSLMLSGRLRLGMVDLS